MASDEERREVARRLRGLRGGWSSGECYYTIIHELDLPDTSREDGGHALYGTLADLIEPSCDRDALLRLARYMDKDVAETEAHFSNVISTKSVSDYARRIRKALGVES